MILIDEIDGDIKNNNNFLPIPTYTTQQNSSTPDFQPLVPVTSNSNETRPKTHSRVLSSASALSFFEPSTSATSSRIVPLRTKSCNYLLVERENASIRCPYVIDPELAIPPCFLPELPPGEKDRRNLVLITRNGNIHSDIWIDEQHSHVEFRRTMSADSERTPESSEEEEDFGRRLLREVEYSERNVPVRIKAQNDNGYILLKFHALPHRRLNISVHALNGSAYIFIPRTFSGPLYISNNGGSVHFSSGIEGYVNPLTEERKGGSYFIGDLSYYRRVRWDGDELHIEANGVVFVAYENEPESDLPRGSKFLGKLLSFAK